jgi:hypothetical protein
MSMPASYQQAAGRMEVQGEGGSDHMPDTDPRQLSVFCADDALRD